MFHLISTLEYNILNSRDQKTLFNCHRPRHYWVHCPDLHQPPSLPLLLLLSQDAVSCRSDPPLLPRPLVGLVR